MGHKYSDPTYNMSAHEARVHSMKDVFEVLAVWNMQGPYRKEGSGWLVQVELRAGVSGLQLGGYCYLS